MINSIHIQGVASFGQEPESLSDLSQFNFIYGSNGTGKTTISKLISDDSLFTDCSVVWQGDTKLETLVYNRDFVEKNFNQSTELKGIFTLGEKDKDTLEKIETAKKGLDEIITDIERLKKTLEGEDGESGKKGELVEIENEFEEKCWILKQKHDEKLKGAFEGVRDAKRKFKIKLLSESNSNTSMPTPLVDLEKKAETVFGETPQAESLLTVPDYIDLLAYESDQILKKKIIGKSDVDIAAMIQKLGNSDWVKEGRQFYELNDNVCPFCQQETDASLTKSLNEYFDETFEKDTAAIEQLYTNYKTESERLQHNLQNHLENPSKFLDVDKLKSEKELLDSKIRLNIQHIESKRKEVSRAIELDSIKNILDSIKAIIDSVNDEIRKHNLMVENLEKERSELKGQVWKYLLEDEIKVDLTNYNKKNDDLDKAIASLNEQLTSKNQEKQKKEIEIRTLEKDTTSIQPTIESINSLLRSFGFQGFALAKSEQERFYKIQRPDGTDAKETLSEGEKNFITFLYFYHLLKGSESESGMTTDRVVVFDDPVSSLDSDILFIVSNLIKVVFEEVRTGSGTIKQIFVFTHNVYFHKEVTFNPNRRNIALREETFWTVRKSDQLSKIQKHETNPIKTSYELLWLEVRNHDRSNLSIQNTLRRILESYFKILGNVDPDEICAYFEGKEKLICRSLFSWVNAGSHSAHDDLYVSIDIAMVDIYLRVFKQIFKKSGHIAHYEMMMGEQHENGANVSSVD